MLKIYNTDIETNKIEEIKEFEKGSWINLTNPSDSEIKKVCEGINIEEDFIRYALDQEEKARIDDNEDDGTILFVIDVPTIEKNEENEIYSTMPLGMIEIKNFQTYKKTRFIFQILYLNSAYYLNYLKRINKETEIAEYILKNSMKNKELLKLLSLEKGLVYFTTSLKSNEIVMEKTLRGKIIKLYEEDEEILEDAITENRQAIEMAQIYSNILNGTMDAYASIISNNLNGVMKFLTSITIILAVPTMISSFWGMNVELPFQHSQIGFIIMVGIAVITTILVTLWLNKKDMLK